ncbi:kinectin [Trichonephila clavipes]|nr:kinectin [Trichonephila clavipes]
MTSEKMKIRDDCRGTGQDFHEGDKVWLWNPKRRKGLSTKLQTNWEGPYTVLKRLNDAVVRIQKSPHSKKKTEDVFFPISEIQAELLSEPDKNGNLIEEIVDSARKINLEVDSDDTQELLDCSQTTDELIEMLEQDQDNEELES